jgi:trehalose 6-phosphate phosphatase
MGAVAIRARQDQGLFFSALSAAPSRVLLLDYDGTVAPFCVDRNRAFPYATVPDLLDSIMSTCTTRVVLVSGRTAEEIPPLLGLNPAPEIWGVHGLERRCRDGHYDRAYLREEALQALTQAQCELEVAGLAGLVETKLGSVALHWRTLNQQETAEARTTAYCILAPLACRANLLLQEFEGGLELRVRGASKGHVVRTILSETDDEAPIAYLGDDVTDEDAFRSLGDRGLTVLVRPQYRPTAAQVWLRPPEELVQFFTDWIRACGGDL